MSNKKKTDTPPEGGAIEGTDFIRVEGTFSDIRIRGVRVDGFHTFINSKEGSYLSDVKIEDAQITGAKRLLNLHNGHNLEMDNLIAISHQDRDNLIALSREMIKSIDSIGGNSDVAEFRANLEELERTISDPEIRQGRFQHVAQKTVQNGQILLSGAVSGVLGNMLTPHYVELAHTLQKLFNS